VNRREFIVTAAGTLCAPLAVWAQQPGRLFRTGWLDYSSAAENLGIFVQAMSGRGWVQDKNFRIEYRGGEGKAERLEAVAAELVRLPADIIIAPGTPEALAARKATQAIPIVMTGADNPVELGLVDSLPHPGGNVTGLAGAGTELSGKLLSLLRELAPRMSRAAVLLDSTDPDHRARLRQLQAAAKTLGVSLDVVTVRRYSEIEPAFATIKQHGSELLIVPPSSMLVPRLVADLALKNGLPLASTSPSYAYEGGLMAYADDWSAVFDRVASFVDRILKGAKPTDLPVELPDKFKLIVNAKTARALGLAMPPSIMILADSVIES